MGLVMWLMRARRVRGVTAARIGVERLRWLRDRDRDPGDDDPRAVSLGDGRQRVEGRVVLVVGRQEFIARLEPQGPQHGVHATGRVRHEREADWIRAEERGDPIPRIGQRIRQDPLHEPDRLRLEAIPPRALGREDGLRARAVRAVVQERDGRIESPAEVGAHRV